MIRETISRLFVSIRVFASSRSPYRLWAVIRLLLLLIIQPKPIVVVHIRISVFILR
jgi:hypothetical protein